MTARKELVLISGSSTDANGQMSLAGSFATRHYPNKEISIVSNRSNRHVVPARLAGMVLLSAIFYAAAATAGDKDAIIINDASMPVPTRDVEQSSREPYEAYLGTARNDGLFTYFPAVPDDRQLVIEYVSASCHSSAGQKPHVLILLLGVGHYFPTTVFENPPTASVYVSQQTRLYAAPGTEVGVAIYPSSTLPSANCNVALSGYLTDF